MTVYESPRKFLWWVYTVSMRQLLLRAVKEDGASTRVDLCFGGVTRVQLPASLRGVRVERDGDLFVLTETDGQRWEIEAVSFNWHEDDLEYNDPCHFELPCPV